MQAVVFGSKLSRGAGGEQQFAKHGDTIAHMFGSQQWLDGVSDIKHIWQIVVCMQACLQRVGTHQQFHQFVSLPRFEKSRQGCDQAVHMLAILQIRWEQIVWQSLQKDDKNFCVVCVSFRSCTTSGNGECAC